MRGGGQIKSRSSRFKETCALEHQRAVPHKSRYFTVVGKPTVKTVPDRHGYAAYHNNQSINHLFDSGRGP